EETDKIIVSSHAEVTMLFADIVGFTALSAKTSPEQLISILNELFSAFDELTLQYKLEKIKTIGDCYFVASGGLFSFKTSHISSSRLSNWTCRRYARICN